MSAGQNERPSTRRRLTAERRVLETVKPLELYFDLVFVLGFTQCTALMAEQPDWEGIAQGALVLAVLWWAWVGFSWLTSAIDPEEGSVRIVIFVAMAALLVVALCVPEAFGDRALPFAIAYGVVSVATLALYVLASRDDPPFRRSVFTLVISSTIAVALLIGASFIHGGGRWSLWVLAVVVHFGGPALVSMARGLGGEIRLVPAHFAERHNLVVILALGESIVALGIGAEADLTAPLVVAAVLGIALASALWWIYFDVVALVTEQRLARAAEGRARNRLARDSYSYLHFPMVAGIVLVALGLEATLSHLDRSLDTERAFALLGGTAIYLLAHVALRLRNAHTVNRQRLALALVLFAMTPVATRFASLTVLAAVNVPLWAMIAYETFLYGENRYRLRHRLPLDPPAS